MAQVWFSAGDLRREMASRALRWRRSPPFFHTCARNARHLRQQMLGQYTNAIPLGLLRIMHQAVFAIC
jgi:hypothetical protein